MRSRLVAAGLALWLLAGGCTDSGREWGWHWPPGGGREYRDTHRWLWHSLGIHDYQFVWTVIHGDRIITGGPYLIQVRHDAVFRVWSIKGDSLLPNSRGMTMEDLFAMLCPAGDEIDGVFHPTLGYPMEIRACPEVIPDACDEIRISRLSTEIVPPEQFCNCRPDTAATRYTFTALDSMKVPLVEGCLSLVFKESPSLSMPERIEGARCLDVLGTLPAPYAFRMDNKVSGGISQWGDITIDLNANTSDSNIILTGRFTGEWHGAFSGRWVYLTMKGERGHGTFAALPAPGY